MMSSDTSLKTYIQRCCDQVDQSLSSILRVADPISPGLLEAMQYSVFNGGKRIRPVLAFAACEAVGGEFTEAGTAACSVELIHAYSLVHDDLPAMDDDNLRRGKPTCHKAFDEATAILVGDTLQTLAFEVLSNHDLGPTNHLGDKTRLQLVKILSQASGLSGMAGGQSMDQYSAGLQLDQSGLEKMHSHKTGALINASVRMGALSHPDVNQFQLDQLERYSRAIGLAFQVQDDILDVISDTETLGKQQGADIALNKPTYVSLMGLENARKLASGLHDQAISALTEFGNDACQLREIADFIIKRTY